MNITRIRQELRKKFGENSFRISCRGAIQVRGPLPDKPEEVGWYFFGWARDVDRHLASSGTLP